MMRRNKLLNEIIGKISTFYRGIVFDLVFIISTILVYKIIGVIADQLPAIKVVNKYTKEQVLQNPGLIPTDLASKFSLVVYFVLMLIVLPIITYFLYIWTRNLIYGQKRFWKAVLGTFVGFFSLTFPLFVVFFILSSVSRFFIKGNFVIFLLLQSIITILFSVIIVMHVSFYNSLIKKGIFDSLGETYKDIVNVRKYYRAIGIITLISIITVVIFSRFFKLTPSTKFLNLVYLLIGIILIDWLRAYVIDTNKEEPKGKLERVKEKVIKTFKKEVKTIKKTKSLKKKKAKSHKKKKTKK